MTTTAAITAIVPLDPGVIGPAITGINASGNVAGDFTTSSGSTSGGLWQAGLVTGSVSLPSLGTSFATAINDSNVVVGYFTEETSSSNPHYAFVWQAGIVTELQRLGGVGSTQANAINNAGVIAGYAITSQGNYEAVTWQNGVISTLTPLTHSYDASSNELISVASGLNQNGAIAGYSLNASGRTDAVLWQNGLVTDLGVATGFWGSVAASVNDLDQVVGSELPNIGTRIAFLWQNNATTLLPSLVSTGDTAALAINDYGIAVGWSALGSGVNPVQHAVMWQNGAITDLNSLLPANSPWVLSTATAINAQNQIVGTGLNNGAIEGYVLTLTGASATLNSAQGVVQAFKAGTLTAPVSVIDTGADVALYLDGLELAAAAGKISSITLSDTGTPVLSLTAAQTVNDAAALAKIGSSYSLQVNGDGNAVTVAGLAGHATTVSVSLPYEDFTLTAINGNTGLKVTGYSAIATPITDEFDQVGAVTFSDGTHAYVGAWGVSAIRSLGTLPAGTLEPWSIDGATEIVGYAGTTASPTLETGFYWYDGKITTLSPLRGAQGTEALHATGSLIVGESYAANSAGGSSTAVYWKTSDLFTGYTIPTSIGWLTGDFASLAISANYSGDIVGESYTTSTTYHGFLLKNGTMSDIGGLGGGQVEPLSINYSDLIVGKASVSGGAFHAFSWQDGIMTDLGVLTGGTTSVAEAVNNSGTIVGYSTDSSGLDQAVYWSNGQLHRLPNLLNATVSIANAVNDGGCIVGESANSSGAVAVLWANGALYNLNSFLPSSGSGWVLGDALSINDYNQVSGTGLYNGLSASFVLDLPANLVLTATGALLEEIDNELTGKVNIGDTAAKVAATLDALHSLATAGELGTITLTDAGVPNLTITSAQYSADSSVLDDISGVHTVTVQMGGNASQFDFSSGNVPHAAALQFADQTVILAATPGKNSVTTGNITELYAAVLGREPDIGGLAFYQNYLKSNPATPLAQFAQWFLQSSEYTSSHVYAPDSTGDAKFITDSYQNLLHRAPDTGAVAFYQGVIDSFTKGLVQGSAAYTAAEALGHAWVLTYFSASSEFLGDVQITGSHPADAQHWLVLA